MTYSSPSTAASGLVLSNLAPQITSFADVKQWCLHADKARYAKAVDRLSRIAHNTPLSGIEATETALDVILPRSSKWKANPYPSEFKTTDAYKHYRRKVQAAFRGATSSSVPTTAHTYEQDDWSELLSLLSRNLTPHGKIDSRRMISFKLLAERCRCLAITPLDLATEDAILRLDQDQFNTRRRGTLGRALKFFRDNVKVVPGLAGRLPDEPVLTLDFARKVRNDVPPHLDAELASWIDKASEEGYDETSERYVAEWSKQTRERYRAAFRHFLTTLRRNGVDTDSSESIADLATPANLNLWIDSVSDAPPTPGVISSRTLFQYSSDIHVLLERVGHDVSKVKRTIKGSGKLRKGRAETHKMAKDVREFCERLIKEPRAERIFASQARLYREGALALLRDAGGESTALGYSQRADFIRRGSMAAFAAIQLHGAPERKGVCLQLKISGNDRNIFPPSRGRKLWSFQIAGELTKAGKERPNTEIDKTGSDILTWYVEQVRPLLDPDGTSPWFFPAPEKVGPLPPQTFDGWILRSSEELGLRMTAHKFRSGQATRLLNIDWNNLPLAANLLCNTQTVCARNYAWIDTKRVHRDAMEQLRARDKEIGA